MKKYFTLIGIAVIILILILSIFCLYFLDEDNKEEFKVTVINLTDERLVVIYDILSYTEEERKIEIAHGWLSPNDSSTVHFEIDKSVSIENFIIRVYNHTYYYYDEFEDDDVYLRWNGFSRYNVTENGIHDLYAIVIPAPSDINMTNLPYPKYFIGNTGLNPMDVIIVKMNDYVINRNLIFS